MNTSNLHNSSLSIIILCIIFLYLSIITESGSSPAVPSRIQKTDTVQSISDKNVLNTNNLQSMVEQHQKNMEKSMKANVLQNKGKDKDKNMNIKLNEQHKDSTVDTDTSSTSIITPQKQPQAQSQSTNLDTDSYDPTLPLYKRQKLTLIGYASDDGPARHLKSFSKRYNLDLHLIGVGKPW
eukprot:CAMPEP_0201593780 /NCGR_PEP_ID=MMETSP0190_2-20130828/191292_1 /ASSEMBLY_ACC=CAM_ASM_000263 /TAXON_ID=37353 /ORGANISM="Rosalina sp." /LENGTH=180 /DNA_ID=CAMNT_0048053125 /DNA_START=235 /DNA_END=774 /DNA_ORIENTATION=+